MGYKVKIDNEVFDIKDGFTLKDEFNETLDSGTIQIPVYGRELNKEPFDSVVIFHTENKIQQKKLELDSAIDEIYSFNDSIEDSDHLYTIEMFSETKELERITCPSCSVSQPLEPSATKTSVAEQIERFCNIFLPRIKVGNSQSFSYRPCFNIDQSVLDKFSNVDCPELQWDKPTLREILNDLFSVKDCIPVVRNNTIYYYDLTLRKNPIDVTKLSRMTSSISSSDYAPELTMYMKNAIGKNTVESFSYQRFKTVDESGEITTDNAAIVTQKPIYSIKSLKIYAIMPQKNNSQHYGIDVVDVASRTVEYDAWKIKSKKRDYNSSSIPRFTDEEGFTTPDHKLFFLYYKRGGYSIENFGVGYKDNTIPTPHTYTFRTKVWGAKLQQFINGLPGDYTLDINAIEDYPIRKYFYKIEYETIYDKALSFGRYLPVKHPENKVFDNQSNSFVDIHHQSIFEYAKVNRLSNQVKEIYGEYEIESEIPELGDYIGEYILFSRQVSYYDNKFLFKGYLTKNYILRDFYTGVLSKKRSWKIAPAEDALIRHEIVKFYVEASFFRKRDSLINGRITNIILNSTGHGEGLINDLACLKKQNDAYSQLGASIKMKQIRVQTFTNDETFPMQYKGIAMDSEIEVYGYSLSWTFGFDDNYKGCDYLINEGTDGPYVQDFYPYANSEGKVDRINIDIGYQFKDRFYYDSGYVIQVPEPANEENYDDVFTLSNSDINPLLDSIAKRPVVDRLDFEYSFSFTLNLQKDMREIIKATVQIEYCADVSDIIVKPEFLNHIRATAGNDIGDYGLKVWTSTEDVYDMSSTEPKGTSNNASHIIYTDVDSKTIKVEPSGLIQNIKSWCISTNNNEILLAVNGNKPVYFNLLSSRDTNIYDSVVARNIVGTIKIN